MRWLIGFFVGGFLILCWISSISCHSRFNRATEIVNIEWGPVQGCMIETKQNGWISSDNYSVID